MGKGKQSKHDRKESRKEGRDNVKRDAKQLKAPSRKVKAKGGISKIEMTSEGEEMLLRLITMLDSGDLEVNLASALPIITEDSDDNDDSSSDGTNDEQDVISDHEDSDDSDDEDDDDEDDFSKDMKKITVAPLSVSKNNVIFTDKQRRSLVRKLIRDDRRVSIELANRLAEQKVSRNLVAKAKMINEKSKQKGDVASEHISIDFNDSVPPQYFSQTTPVSSILRLNISCGSKSGGRVAGGMSKLILTDRTEPLNRLLEIARNKFAAPKKFSQLVILPDGVLLDADGLFLLPDGAQLLLVVGDIGKDAAHRVKTAPVVVDSEVPSTDSDIILKEVDTVSDSESGAPTLVDNYWCPPERSHVIEAQRTPRSIGDYVESNNMREKQIKMFGDPSYKAINTGRSGLPIHKVREVCCRNQLHLTPNLNILSIKNYLAHEIIDH